jgi:hypothetical protein
MALPCDNATSGKNAVEDTRKLLIDFRAKSSGVLEDFEKGEVIAQFVWRARRITIAASSKGCAEPG